jgi:putative tryptophan/tyrosine transport system substrate-binding protein
MSTHADKARRAVLRGGLLLALLAAPLSVAAQQLRIYRVGVVLHGGSYSAAIDGLRDGLKELGLEEGKHFILHVRETKGDLKSVEAAARALESEKVDLIYSVASSITVAVKRATKSVPIVFYAGADPVSLGLVESFRKPGGRLTGTYSRFTDLVAKRLQLLKEMIPGMRRVMMFYNPDNPAAPNVIKAGRGAARNLKIELIERPIASVDDLRDAMRALRPGEVDAFYSADAMVISQIHLVLDVAIAKRLPTIFADRDAAVKGALASYGTSYYVFGRSAAKKVERILLGTNPGDLPVEQLDRLYFVVNLKTAKALGLTIPQSVLQRADEIIE